MSSVPRACRSRFCWPRRAHLATRRVLHTLEHPPVQLALPSVSQALRRSLEPATKVFCRGGVAFPSDGSRMACSRQDTEKYVQYTEKYMNAISIALPFRQWNYLRCMAKDDAVFRRMERKESNWH